eukprot:6185420-Pleurochrysis_carterae.AAC.1
MHSRGCASCVRGRTKAKTAKEAVQQRSCAAAGEQSQACFGPSRISKLSRIGITGLEVWLDHRSNYHPGRNICNSSPVPPRRGTRS